MNNQIKYRFRTRVWQDGFTGTLRIKNSGDLIDSWQAVFESEFAINQEDGKYEILGAEVISEEELTDGKYRYVIEPLPYNSVLDSQEAIFVHFNSNWSEPEISELSNVIFNILEDDPEEEPGNDPEDINNYEFDFDIQINPWSHNSGATVILEVINTGDNEILDAAIKFSSDFQIRELPTDIWGAEIISETAKDGGYEYVLNLADNEDLAPGEQHSFGFNTEDSSPQITNITINDEVIDIEPEPIPEPIPEPSPEPSPNPGSDDRVQLIFDTDMSNDVDDVAALAMIHALANQGEANLLAVVTNANGNHNRTASTADAINTYYNRPDIPIGVTKVSGLQQDGSWYGGSLHTKFPHDTPNDDQVADAVDVLRATLAAAEDNSITYVSVGYLVNMASLLNSGPDEHSNLNGMDLVQQKVKEAVIMGGQYPYTGKEWNFSRNRPYDTQHVVDNWPTRIVFSGAEIGYRMYSGTSLQQAPDSNPVKYAHTVFRGFDTPNNAITDGYHTWDQTAVLWAVRGDEDLWRRVDNGFNQVNSDGSSQWQTWRDDPRQEYLVKTQDNSRYVNIVNDLYLVPPMEVDPLTGSGVAGVSFDSDLATIDSLDLTNQDDSALYFSLGLTSEVAGVSFDSQPNDFDLGISESISPVIPEIDSSF